MPRACDRRGICPLRDAPCSAVELALPQGQREGVEPSTSDLAITQHAPARDGPKSHAPSAAFVGGHIFGLAYAFGGSRRFGLPALSAELRPHCCSREDSNLRPGGYQPISQTRRPAREQSRLRCVSRRAAELSTFVGYSCSPPCLLASSGPAEAIAPYRARERRCMRAAHADCGLVPFGATVRVPLLRRFAGALARNSVPTARSTGACPPLALYPLGHVADREMAAADRSTAPPFARRHGLHGER